MPLARPWIMGPLKPSSVVRSSSSAAAFGSLVGSAEKAPKRLGLALTAACSRSLTRRVNDRLHAAVNANPKRFGAFSALPTSDPKAAADELERTTELGFKGPMIHGLANGMFLDDKRFWPIFERAQSLDVPIYLHPSVPLAAVMDAYYKDYVKDFPMVIRAAWGYTVETATQAIRLVLGGVFEAYPRLKVVLGHLGETLPFLVWRVGQAPARARRR